MKLLGRCIQTLSLAGASLLAHGAAAASWPILESVAQTQCAWPSRDAALRLVASEQEWQAALASTAPSFQRTPDWRKQVVVVLTLGARPTPGYAIDLKDEKHFSRNGATLQLKYAERTPAPGAILPQTLSQPCMLLLVQRGDWHKLVARSLSDGTQLQAALATPGGKGKTPKTTFRPSH